MTKDIPQSTPAAQWRQDGEPDPHGKVYDCERAALPMGDQTDDELANTIFMEWPPAPGLAYAMAAKERIRWLSRSLVKQTARNTELENALALFRKAFLSCSSAHFDHIDDEGVKLLSAADQLASVALYGVSRSPSDMERLDALLAMQVAVGKAKGITAMNVAGAYFRHQRVIHDSLRHPSLERAP